MGRKKSDKPQRPQHFVRVSEDGTHFTIKDQPFLIAGANCPSLVAMAAVPGNKRYVTGVLDATVAAGLTVLRVFAFQDGPGGLQHAPGEFSEDWYRALDFVVHEAGQRGLRLILVLTNYASEGGGMRVLRRWSCARRGLPEEEQPDAFFSDPACQDLYKTSLVKIIDRENVLTRCAYRDDPTIMAWSLANAPRCVGDYSGSTLHEWAEGASEFLKALDPNHLVTMDVEGFFGGSSTEYVQCNPFDVLNQGTDFFRNCASNGLDYASFQCWPDEWLPTADEGALQKFTDRWIEAHAALSLDLGKPLLLSAFGKKPAGKERADHMHRVFTSVAQAVQGQRMAGVLFMVLAVPGWQGYYPEYHVFLDAPRPGEQSIRHFRSDDEDSDEGEMVRAPSKARSLQMTAAEDYETVQVVHAAADAFRRLQGDKTDCCVM